MKTLIEDIEIIKKRIAHLRKLALKGGGQDIEQVGAEIDLIKSDIASLKEKDESFAVQIADNDQDILMAQQKIEEHNTALESHQLSINDIMLSCQNQQTEIEQLQEENKVQTQSISSVQFVAESIENSISQHDQKISDLESANEASGQRLDNLENAVDSQDGKLTAIEQTLSSHEQSIQANYDKIDSCQITLGGVYNDVYAMKGKVSTNEQNISSLQTTTSSQGQSITSINQRTTALESLVGGMSGGGDVLGDYVAFTLGYANQGTGYVEFKVSSSKILRIFFGITKSNAVLNFDKPFDEVLWAITVPCHVTQTLATHYSTLATITTSAMSFVGGAVPCRFEVWGFINT